MSFEDGACHSFSVPQTVIGNGPFAALIFCFPHVVRYRLVENMLQACRASARRLESGCPWHLSHRGTKPAKVFLLAHDRRHGQHQTIFDHFCLAKETAEAQKDRMEWERIGGWASTHGSTWNTYPAVHLSMPSLRWGLAVVKKKKSPREGPLNRDSTRSGSFLYTFYREAPTYLLAVDASDVDQRHHAIALDHLLSTLRCHVCNHGDLVSICRRGKHHVHKSRA